MTVAPSALNFVGRLGELVRLDRAAGRERRGIKIQHDRALLQGIRERKREGLAGERRLGGEIRGLCAGFASAAYNGRRKHADKAKSNDASCRTFLFDGSGR